MTSTDCCMLNYLLKDIKNMSQKASSSTQFQKSCEVNKNNAN